MMNGQAPPFGPPPRCNSAPRASPAFAWISRNRCLLGPRRPPREIHANFTERVLADLKSSTAHVREQALNRLTNAPPNDRRAEVAKAVEPG